MGYYRTNLDFLNHFVVFNLKPSSDQLRHFGTMRDVLVFQLDADEEQQVPEFQALDNINGLRNIKHTLGNRQKDVPDHQRRSTLPAGYKTLELRTLRVVSNGLWVG
jgi:hypothetical protein